MVAKLREPDLNDRFQRPLGAVRPVVSLALDAKPRRRKSGDVVLRPIHPNAGIEAAYRKKLLALVDEMHRSFAYHLKAAYRKNEPAMAMDATPAADLQDAIDKLTKRWRERFRDGAESLADYFATAAFRRSDELLMRILRDAGFSVRFKMTPAMRDVLRATVEQNVALIKSIPEQYLTQVQGAVMRSVQTGRDLASLSKELQKQFGVTRRRAAFISLDQNNKATAALRRARETEAGLDDGIWMHSHAGREPRPTHLANDGKKFSISRGWYDPDPNVRRRILPGELPRCRCTWKVVIKGFS